MHRVARLTLCFILLAVFLSAAHPVRVQTQAKPTVVMVSLTECCKDAAWPEAEERIAREFIQAGLEVVTLQGKSMLMEDPGLELGRLALTQGARAAVRIVRKPSSQRVGVDLWIAGQATGESVYRYLPLDDTTSKESSVVAALKTLELFKNNGEELNVGGGDTKSVSPEQGDIEEPNIEEPKRAPILRRFRIGAGFAGLFFPGNMGPRGAPTIVLGWMPAPRMFLQLEGSVGFLGKDIAEGDDSSSMIMSSIVLKPMWEFLVKGLLRPSLGLTIGVSFVNVSGESDHVGKEQKDRMTAAFLGATVQLGIAVTNAFWITPSFDVAVLVPQASVMFQGSEVVSFGAPVLKTTLMLEVHF